jgi:hypothetical protein
MRASLMPKQLSALILTAFLAVLSGGIGMVMAATDPDPWTVTCGGAGSMPATCMVATRQDFPNAFGGADEMTVALRVDAQCSSLHVSFNAPIATDRPVGLTVDGGKRLAFYTNPELARLARAIDDRVVPDGAPAEFVRFFNEVEAGALARDTTPGRELVARFAHIKEPHRIGMACTPTERLMADLRTGRMLVVDFWMQPRADTVELYHWPKLGERSVAVSLRGLAEALDKAVAVSSAPSN